MEFDNDTKRIVDILNDGKDMQLLEKLVDSLIKSGVKIDFDCGVTHKYWHSSKFPKYQSVTYSWGECCTKVDFSEHDNEITEYLVKENENLKRQVEVIKISSQKEKEQKNEEKMKNDGFNLLLQDFCSYCPDFQPEVEKIDCTAFGEATRFVNNIRCINRKKCSRIVENLEGKWFTKL